MRPTAPTRAVRAAVDRRAVVTAAVIALLLVGGYAALGTPGLGPTPPETVPDDASVTLSRAACFGTCPVYAVRVCGDGTVHYHGGRFVTATGSHRLSVDEARAERLVRRTYRIGFFGLDERYEVPATDLPTTTTTVRVGDDRHAVSNYGGAGPERLAAFENAVAAVVADLAAHDPDGEAASTEPSLPSCAG